MLNLPRSVPMVQGSADLREIDAAALHAYASQWQPHLTGEPDADWTWASYIQGEGTEYGRRSNEFVAHCGLWSGNVLEGLIVLSGPHSCRSDAHADAPAVYIEFVAIAPWHRKIEGLSPPAGALLRTAGIGACLMNEAIGLSHGCGYRGLVAWHSKDSAVTNYDRMFARTNGQTPLRCGTDDETGEVGMELDATLVHGWRYP